MRTYTPVWARRAAWLLVIWFGLLGYACPPSQGAAPVSATELDSYIARVARAWEPYTATDGHVVDPLDPADGGDNYGVIMLADVMLRVAARDGDASLTDTAEHIIKAASTLPTITGPFNFLATATLLRHGQAGDFPPQAWAQLAAPVAALAARAELAAEEGCLVSPRCYSNWRLVWSAGASAFLASAVPPRGGEPAGVAAQISADLAMAVGHAGRPINTSIPGGPARELSDPGSEPPAYHLFSCALLELIAQEDPAAMMLPVERLRVEADRYALDMMAPDGQLSFSGRSLDQSWVQAAAADLGARRAQSDPAHAAAWRSFADRAFSYLARAYPTRPDGVVPIVPGLAVEWNPAIVDPYAALGQYEGLTLWFLADALEHWPEPSVPRSPIPTDASGLSDDLGSSGLVWGRAGNVWWQLSGRAAGSDPRSALGLVAVKVATPAGWTDLLALRPMQPGLPSTWKLTMPGGRTAVPVLTRVRGGGRRAVLTGSYRGTNGKTIASARWRLTTTSRGIRLAMSLPRRARMRATVWLADGDPHLAAGAARLQSGACTVTASGRACPATLSWTPGRHVALEVGG